MRLNLTTRVCLAAATLLGIFGASRALQDRAMPTELAHPRLRMDQMPKTFESWTCGDIDTKLDPRVFEAIGAEMVINRRYQQRQSVVDVHSAVFLRYGVRTLHPPELCYQGIGYMLANMETVQIAEDSRGGHAASLLSLDKDGTRVYCLYWYQVGDSTFWDGDGQRRVVQSFRGQTVWPPMIKVMLQTTANSPEEATMRLKSLAALVYPWTRDFR